MDDCSIFTEDIFALVDVVLENIYVAFIGDCHVLCCR